MAEIRPLEPLQPLGNFSVIGKRNRPTAHGQDLFSGNLGDLDLARVAIEFRRDLLANPRPAMGIVDVRGGNPAMGAQFSNCRRHAGLGLHALPVG